MKQFQWRNWILVVFLLISFACKSISPENNLPTQNQTQVSENSTPASEAGDFSVNPVNNWLMFLGSKHWNVDVTHDTNGNAYVLEKLIPANTDERYRMLYLRKISNNGQEEWQIPISETYSGSTDTLITDTAGNVYVAGSNGETWGNPKKSFSANGKLGLDVSVAKIDPNGNLLWNTFIGNSGSTTISLDNQGNLYLVKFDKQDTAKQSNYSLVKLDGDGNILFDKTISGLSYVYPYLLTVAHNNNVYISGNYTDINGDLSSDLFIAKLTNTGELEWNKNVSGKGANAGIAGIKAKIQVDSNGNTYVFGLSQASWGNPINPYDGGYEIDDPNYEWQNGLENFIAKIDDNGNTVWNTFLNKSVWVYGTAMDDRGNLYFTGYSDADWGNSVIKHNPNKNDDGFIALIDTNSGLITWNIFVGGDGKDFIDGVTILGNQIYVIGGTDTVFGNPLNKINSDGEIDRFISSISLR